MARVALLVISLLGLSVAAIAFVGLVSDIATAQHLNWSGWAVEMKEETRTSSSYSLRQESVPVLWLPLFGVATVFFLVMAFFGSGWLTSRHRPLWFGGCALIAFGLCVLGGFMGFLLFAPVVIAMVIFAATRSRPEESSPGSAA